MGPRKHFKMPKKQVTLPETENRPSEKDTSSFNHQFSGNIWGHVSFRKGSLQRTIFGIAKKAPESSVADAFGVTVRRSQCNRSPKHSAELKHHPTARHTPPVVGMGAHWEHRALTVLVLDDHFGRYKVVFHREKKQHLVEELVTACMWISVLKNAFLPSNNTSSKKMSQCVRCPCCSRMNLVDKHASAKPRDT